MLYAEHRADYQEYEVKIFIRRRLSLHPFPCFLTVLNFAFTEEVRSQDAPYVFSHLSGNPAAKKIVWAYFQENWKKINDKFSGGSFLLGRLVSSVCGSHTSEEKAREIEAFFGQFPKSETSAVDKEILQSVEKVRASARWVASEAENTAKWLKDQGY